LGDGDAGCLKYC